MNEYISRTCVYYPPWESNLLRFQYYFVGVQYHWLILMQAISLYRSRPDPRESVRNSSSVYQDTRYQDFPLIAMSGYPLKKEENPHPYLQERNSNHLLFLSSVTPPPPPRPHCRIKTVECPAVCKSVTPNCKT